VHARTPTHSLSLHVRAAKHGDERAAGGAYDCSDALATPASQSLRSSVSIRMRRPSRRSKTEVGAVAANSGE
jgi:hypothetical protein